MRFGHLMLCDQREGISSQDRYEQMMEEVRLMDRLDIGRYGLLSSTLMVMP